MPNEMLNEFIGNTCIIAMFNELSAVQGIILSVEENWIKVEEKKKIRIINGDMIRDISMLKQLSNFQSDKLRELIRLTRQKNIYMTFDTNLNILYLKDTFLEIEGVLFC